MVRQLPVGLEFEEVAGVHVRVSISLETGVSVNQPVGLHMDRDPAAHERSSRTEKVLVSPSRKGVDFRLVLTTFHSCAKGHLMSCRDRKPARSAPRIFENQGRRK